MFFSHRYFFFFFSFPPCFLSMSILQKSMNNCNSFWQEKQKNICDWSRFSLSLFPVWCTWWTFNYKKKRNRDWRKRRQQVCTHTLTEGEEKRRRKEKKKRQRFTSLWITQRPCHVIDWQKVMLAWEDPCYFIVVSPPNAKGWERENEDENSRTRTRRKKTSLSCRARRISSWLLYPYDISSWDFVTATQSFAKGMSLKILSP